MRVVNYLSERKQKNVNDPEIELDEGSGFVLEPARVEVGSGYTLSVSYDENEKPVISVKTYGVVNLSKLKREIEKAYPDARIQHVGKKPSVTVVAKASKTKRRK